jgi:hypothetical protein
MSEELIAVKANEIREELLKVAIIYGVTYNHDNPDHQLVVAYVLGLKELAQESVDNLIREVLRTAEEEEYGGHA